MAQGQQRRVNAPIRGFHMTEAESELLATRGVEGPNALQLMRAIEATPPDVMELSEADLADTVLVRCVVDTRPWTHERALRDGEEAKVPRKVAERMAENMQIRILGDK